MNLLVDEGIFRWPGGAIYAGEWKDDRRHGRGFYKVLTTYLPYRLSTTYIPYRLSTPPIYPIVIPPLNISYQCITITGCRWFNVGGGMAGWKTGRSGGDESC